MSWLSAISGRDRAKRALQQLQASAAADPNSPQSLAARSNAVMDDFQNYDPQAAINQYAQGAWGSISSALNQNLDTLRGDAVSAGRLDTGFYDQDVGKIYGQATSQLANALAQQSVAGAGLKLRGMEDYGDLVNSRFMQAENDRREEEERKRKNRGGLAGAIGTGLGYLAGGPVGGYVGGGIAGAIFS